MGIFLSLLSCIFSTSKDLISKRLAAQVDGTVSTFGSFAFALPYYGGVLAVLFWLGLEDADYSRRFFLLVLLRAITDSFAEGLKMYALAYGDISVVTCFFSLSPLFLLIASPLITGDELTWTGGVAIGLTVAGSLVMVVRRPRALPAVDPTAITGESEVEAAQAARTHWANQKTGILLALGAAVFFALNSCFDRLAVLEGTPVFAAFGMTLCSALLLAPLVLFRRDRLADLSAYRGNFALRGFLEISFMVAKMTALKYLAAPYVVGIQRVSLILAIIAGRVLFKEEHFARRLVAGALILAGVLLIVLTQ